MLMKALAEVDFAQPLPDSAFLIDPNAQSVEAVPVASTEQVALGELALAAVETVRAPASDRLDATVEKPVGHFERRRYPIVALLMANGLDPRAGFAPHSDELAPSLPAGPRRMYIDA